MKKKYTFVKVGLTVVSLCSSLVLCAQQLPDPGFEDWSGELFDGNIQPKVWNFSNVEQLGVKKNFAHQAEGRSGYCLKIQDQFVGIGTIGATSPGYVSLGHPWAYVSSLFSISDATAGTYGGIRWQHRPDSMVVWVKRVYDDKVVKPAGNHIADESFHLLYYAWSGTAKGGSYKAKNESCTNITKKAPQYSIDEESDIRQATDGNECGTVEPATQVAEGWWCQRKAYTEWTRISVPIYYMNDVVPQKCNVILSAGNYPNFRANTGLYAGNTLYVDDIQLIYSSAIQQLYVGGRLWKDFDPTKTEQTFVLDKGVTEVPEIVAMRGVGSLTNSKGETARFAGRRLNSKECVITKGTVNGAPTTLLVRAEDGSSTTTYKIRFVNQ